MSNSTTPSTHALAAELGDPPVVLVRRGDGSAAHTETDGTEVAGVIAWPDALAAGARVVERDPSFPAAPVPVPVAADAPLWVLFSSGTTGRPKGVVHGHAGVVVEHFEAAGLHSGLGPGDVYFWYSSPSWMMWNFRLAGLLVGAAVRERVSPWHVPDEVLRGPGIPHTRTGKKLEVPVTAMLAGRPAEIDPQSVDRPELLDWYRERVEEHVW